ncbi:unnamed protein product, partial [Oikopleura dioica]
TIKSLRSDFACQLNVPDAQGPERVLRFVCEDSNVSPLIEKVGNLLRNDMVERNRAQADSDIDMRMLVHQSKAGAVIGFKGETIKGLRDKTGCKINVYQDPAPHSSDRLIKVAGQPDKIATCFGEILLILNDIPPKGFVQEFDPENADSTFDYGGFAYEDANKPAGFDRGGRNGRGGGGRGGGSRGGGGRGAGGRGGGGGFGGGRGGGFGGGRGGGSFGGGRGGGGGAWGPPAQSQDDRWGNANPGYGAPPRGGGGFGGRGGGDRGRGGQRGRGGPPRGGFGGRGGNPGGRGGPQGGPRGGRGGYGGGRGGGPGRGSF